jgi:adenylate cyclase
MAGIRLRTFSYFGLITALIGTALLVRQSDPFIVRALRLAAFDSYQRIEPRNYDPEVPIRIIDIDESSLKELGQWPWPRTTLGDLAVRLAENGAAAIAFDMLFAEPDRTSFEEIIRRLPKPQAELLTAATSGQTTNDQALANSLKEIPSVVGVSLGDGPQKTLTAKAGFAVAGANPRSFITAFNGASVNLRPLDESARGIGAINWVPDRDQIIRRVALVFRLNETLIPSLAAEALRVAQGASSYVLKASNASGETGFGEATGLNHIRIGTVEIPTDSSGAVYLRFRHTNPSQYISAWKVLEGKVPHEDIEGRIIFVGTSAPGLLDLRATPLDVAVPGVEMHAQVLERILAGDFLTRPDYALGLEQFIIVVLGLALAILLPRLRAVTSAIVGLVAVGSLLIGGWLAFKYAGLLFDPSYPALFIGILTGSITLFIYQGAEAQRRQIRHAFARYLAPAVVEEIVANPNSLKLGGEERELTLMFCDVRNFTTISQDLSAVELTHFINELLSPLSEIILKYRGTIDKYMGDAIMAFWNAPLSDPDQTVHACTAALEMAAQMDVLNEHWRRRATASNRPFKPVKIGIGINTGQCCVGNLGSIQRFDYSAIGDEVNITSRFEGLTKFYGVTAIVGERSLAPSMPTLELDYVLVKGRTRPTRIYTLSGLLGADETKLKTLCALYGRFLETYRAQQWDAAERLLSECRELGVAELDELYSIFACRIEDFRRAPKMTDWDGSFTMVEK